MALEGVFGNMGKRKRKGFLGLFCGMGERSPHTHDMSMEGRERIWRERRKGKNKGEERKGKERCQDFLVFSQAGLYMYVYVYLYLKSRNHDFIEGIEGIGWHYRTASSSSE